MQEWQRIKLRNRLLDAGLREQQVYDILLLLRFKPARVQDAFYYSTLGYTYAEMALMLMVSPKQAWKYINVNCADIREYLTVPVY